MPIKARQSSRSAFAATATALFLAALVGMAGAAPASSQKRDLTRRQDELRGRIDVLRRDLAKNEESRASVAERLRETESAISTANRELHRLANRQRATQEELRDVESQSRRLADQTIVRQRQLSRLLYRQFTRGDADALRLLLVGRDPNQAAMDQRFLEHLSMAQAEAIADLRTKAREQQRLGGLARDKSAELESIEQARQRERAALIEQRRQREEILAKATGRIKAQQREIGALRRDEQRLASLIGALARAAARPPRPAGPVNGPKGGTTSPDRRTNDSIAMENPLAAPKNPWILPVRGEIAGRFGRPRPEGGAAWKGLFIRAPEGTEVRAAAAGRVVHADWLRGYGNLLVLDHGEGLLSVYGNNESLLREAGQTVKAGEVVATVGNTGGNAESGLYFELRRQGQAFDPLRWVNPR